MEMVDGSRRLSIAPGIWVTGIRGTIMCIVVLISVLVDDVLMGELRSSRVCIMRASSEDQFNALGVPHLILISGGEKVYV